MGYWGKSVKNSLLLAGTLSISACTTLSSPLPTPYSAIAGTWGFREIDECSINPRDFVFSRDLRTMSAVHDEVAEAGDGDLRKIFRYQVLSSSTNSLHLSLDGETRLDAAGRPVTWHLSVFEDGTLRWRQDDWPAGEYTSELVRCEI